ncbi:Uncharacterised protein [Mycobacteroides abscessus subsp. massiliense]|uniref:Uncharacterized protein n=1 Tax=Mycobacteroides saopaulense TaxID=1578165 RepID=A0ABX3BYE7_9MYCO|nr:MULTISPECIES: hypothetical protein [Mycobacteroides]AMU64813.1 hypothetical protein A3O04_05595 [Mycobacteroides abscessus]ANO13939.1 hypothetical protein BAB77_08810 [Mycobacteroides abscessus]ANO14617.1 hypothetical protein BAB77_12745 [Mycobacteroides abscessus]MBE5405729.1 hypothetical protein [Mycobacteroides abscessus]MBE5429560.1 hypothetical protein [Mycobacteroides abscessus]
MNIRELSAVDQLFAAANDHLSEAVITVKEMVDAHGPEEVWDRFIRVLTERIEAGDSDIKTIVHIHATALIRLARQS